MALPLLIFIFLFGKSYWDFHHAVEQGQAQIARTVGDGTQQIKNSEDSATASISALEGKLPAIDQEINTLQRDAAKYKAANDHINKLQTDVLGLQKDVIDLGQKTLKVEMLQTTGAGAGLVSFGKVGCPSPDLKKWPISLCAEGSPLMFNSLTPGGFARPISSFSDIGFQDISTLPKPTCDLNRRGTIYVQKGGIHQADRPLVCVKSASDTYIWLALTNTN